MDILHKMEKNRKTFWNISPELGIFLNQIIIAQNYKSILEIGTSNGYSGIWIGLALKKNNGKLITIESHKERFLSAQKNFKKSGLENYITQIKGHAPEDIPNKPKKFNMAFFDATKYEHIDYFKKISERIKKNGIIITDNTVSHAKELKEYLKFIKKQKNWKLYNFNLGSGFAIAYKNQ